MLVSWISQFGNDLASPRAGISLRRAISRNRAGRDKIRSHERLFQKYVVETSRSSPEPPAIMAARVLLQRVGNWNPIFVSSQQYVRVN